MNNNYNSNTIVDGRAAHMIDTTRQSAPEHPPPPLPDHAGSIPVYKDNLKNRIAKNNKVLSTISCTIIVFIIPLLMCQDFEWAIPFNIAPPPIEGSRYPMGGGGGVTLNFPRG